MSGTSQLRAIGKALRAGCATAGPTRNTPHDAATRGPPTVLSGKRWIAIQATMRQATNFLGHLLPGLHLRRSFGDASDRPQEGIGKFVE